MVAFYGGRRICFKLFICYFIEDLIFPLLLFLYSVGVCSIWVELCRRLEWDVFLGVKDLRES